MATYRIYLIAGKYHISDRPQLIECAGDEAAIAHATRYFGGHDLEIWQGPRMLKRFAPKGAS